MGDAPVVGDLGDPGSLQKEMNLPDDGVKFLGDEGKLGSVG